MELACRRGTAAAAADSPEAAGGGAQPEAAQQREQPGQEGGEARERQHASSSPAGSRQKPVVVLVGATLDEPLVEHAVAQVGWLLLRCCWAAAALPLHCRRAAAGLLPAGQTPASAAARPHHSPLQRRTPRAALRLSSPRTRTSRCAPPTHPRQGWVRDPVTVRVGDRMRIPSGLQHRCIVVPDEGAKVAAMCRQIRADLRGCACLRLCCRERGAWSATRCSQALRLMPPCAAGGMGRPRARACAGAVRVRHAARHAAPRPAPLAARACRQSADEAPARVMVFAGSEDEARRLSDPLRTVLWGDHKISGGRLAGWLAGWLWGAGAQLVPWGVAAAAAGAGRAGGGRLRPGFRASPRPLLECCCRRAQSEAPALPPHRAPLPLRLSIAVLLPEGTERSTALHSFLTASLCCPRRLYNPLSLQCCCPRARSPSRPCTRSATTRPRCCWPRPPPRAAWTCPPSGGGQHWALAPPACRLRGLAIGRGTPVSSQCRPTQNPPVAAAAPHASASHVYNLQPPPAATEYLHRAGRSGRIGSPVQGACGELVPPCMPA